MLSRLWQIVAGAAAGLTAILYGMLKWTQHQRAKAEAKAAAQTQRANTAEERIDQRTRADDASRTAKEEGDKHVEQALERARTGRRDHFE